MPTAAFDLQTLIPPDARSGEDRHVDASLVDLARDTHDLLAADQLEARLAGRGDHAGLVALLLDRAEEADDPAARAALLVRVARLYRTELGDLPAARLVLTTGMATRPQDRGLHEELDALACASGDLEGARAAFADAARALAARDRAMAGELWLRIACLHLAAGGPAPSVTAALARVEKVDRRGARPLLVLCERLASDLAALDALFALHERIGDRGAAARVMARAVERTTDPPDRARRHLAVARLAVGRREDLEAEWHFAEAVRLAPERPDARSELAELYRRRGEPRRAVRLLEEARQVATNTVDRAKLACQAAALADEIGERTRAVSLYQAALVSDPDRAEAAAPLAERYWQRGRHAELEPLIELLAGRAAGRRAREAAEIYFRAGRTALALDKHARAVVHLRAALERAPERIDVLRGLAEACERTGQLDVACEAWRRAAELGEQVGADPAAIAADLTSLAILRERSGDRAAALGHYRAALVHAPGASAAIDGAVALLVARRELAAAAAVLAAGARASTGEARVALLVRQAALHAGGLGDPAGAAALYREALALTPGDRSALTGLVELHVGAEAWREAVDALLRLAGLEPKGQRRGHYLQIAGQLARGRLDDDEALSLFDRALDAFFAGGEPAPVARPGCLRAFDDLETVLRGRGDVGRLAQAYRAMIGRLAPGAPELPDLRARLAALVGDEVPAPAGRAAEPAAAPDRRRSGERAAAAPDRRRSGERAAAAPDRRRSRERDGAAPERGRSRERASGEQAPIDLYGGAAPDALDELVGRRQRLLRAAPFDRAHHRALADLERRAGRRDREYLALRAVLTLGGATDEERARVRELAATRPPWLSAPLTAAHHAALRHPDEDPRLTAVLAVVAAPLARALARSPRRLGIGDDRSRASQPLRQLHHAVAAAVGVAAPVLYVDPKIDVEVALCNVVVAGEPQLGIVAGRRLVGAEQVACVDALARAIARVRPACFAPQLFAPPGALDAVLDAALTVGGYRGDLLPAPATDRFAAILSGALAPAAIAALTARVAELGLARGELGIDRWARAVDAGARRLGLLLGGDLTVALAAVAADVGHATHRPTTQHQLADLVVFSSSDEHADLRAELGLALP